MIVLHLDRKWNNALRIIMDSITLVNVNNNFKIYVLLMRTCSYYNELLK